MKEQNSYLIDYKKWSRVVLSAMLVIACFVCATEVVNNILLYVTRSQGYGPDTIVQKLLRYLVLTSATNFLLVFLGKTVDRRVQDETAKRYILMLLVTLMCTNVAFSHYQFAVTFAIFVVPLIISILYEDWKLTIFTAVISLFGETVAVIARAKDADYCKDIGPEAAIAYSLTISILIFARMIITTLAKRRNEVKDAVINAEKANAKAEKMNLSFKMLETLASTLDAKDKYTNGHSMRVAIYATKLAKAIGWEEERVEKLRYEALLHDIGKIGVPDIILNKPSKLTETEFGLIKSHTVIGADILKNMIAVPNASEVAKFHHERYDGKGYPSGVKGEEIPINARIVCIADSYDAMSSDRIYRKALSREIIREELVKGRGSQFDPILLDAFLELFDSFKLNISAEALYIAPADAQQKNVMDDIERVIGRITQMQEQKNELSEFDKFYKYMRNIGLRYNRSIEVLSVDIENTGEEAVTDNESEISDLLQVAIRKNIRAVDVYYRYSLRKHMIILLDAGVDNIGIIKQRIEFEFNLSNMSKGYKLQFALNENIEATKE